MRLWQTIRGYFWWTYDRGSLHYDVMVTLILLFIFVGPRFINFRDKPVERLPHPSGVVVNAAEGDALVFQVEAAAVGDRQGAALDAALLRMIEPISGEVKILNVTPVRDAKGNITGYLVKVQR
jgi:hypothetical protein